MAAGRFGEHLGPTGLTGFFCVCLSSERHKNPNNPVNPVKKFFDFQIVFGYITLFYRLLKKIPGLPKEAFLRSAKPTGNKAPETGNPPRRGGTERCPLREEIPRNEAYMEVRRSDEG
jgi:hypothetical protein